MANIIKHRKFEIDPRKFHESMTIKPSIQQSTTLEESYNGVTDYVIPKIEAIHAGKTRNETFFPVRALKGDPLKHTGVYSWVYPYAKPVIFNHNHDSDSSGRVLKAEYSDVTQAGRAGIILYPKITLPSAVQAIRDERLMTVSIGGECEKLTCSICGTNLLEEGMCQHEPGEMYGGQECHWEIDDLHFDELSWVNVPADSDAMVVTKETTEYQYPTQANESVIEIPKVQSEKDDSTLDIAMSVDNEKIELNTEEKEDRNLDKNELKDFILSVFKEMQEEAPTTSEEEAPEVIVESNEAESETPETTEDTTEKVTENTEEDNKETVKEETKVVEAEPEVVTEGNKDSDDLADMQEALAELQKEVIESKIELYFAVANTPEDKKDEVREELKDLSIKDLNSKIDEAKAAETEPEIEVTESTRKKVDNPMTSVNESVQTEATDEQKEAIALQNKTNLLLKLLRA